jgi:putative DNA primase/helicase
MIMDKITQPTALSYLLNMALRGANRLINNGGFTEPQAVKDALEMYKIDNSNVLTWIEDSDLDEDYFLDNPRDKAFSDFSDWCKRSGVKSTMGKTKFYKEVRVKFDFEEKPRQKADGNRYFTLKI